MTSDRRRALLGALAATAWAGTAVAQDAPRTIPGLDNFTLPASRPSPTPTPTPIPTPAPATLPIPAAPLVPMPLASPPPAAGPTPVPEITGARSATSSRASRQLQRPEAPRLAPAAPLVIPTPAPTVAATPAPLGVATPSPIATFSTTPPVTAQAPESLWPWSWLWLLGAALVLAIAAVVWFVRRRRLDDAIDETIEEPAAMAAPVAAVATDPRPRLGIVLRPLRAGLNLLSATVECELAITNIGDLPAEGIRVHVGLLSAHAGQEGALAAAFAQPIVRPAVPPFALAPGEMRSVRAIAALPRDAIHTMTAAGRQMFVPLVAVNLLYTAGEGRDWQTAQSFVVGIERIDSAKLAPFWLDAPSRMHTIIAARVNSAPLER